MVSTHCGFSYYCWMAIIAHSKHLLGRSGCSLDFVFHILMEHHLITTRACMYWWAGRGCSGMMGDRRMRMRPGSTQLRATRPVSTREAMAAAIRMGRGLLSPINYSTYNIICFVWGDDHYQQATRTHVRSMPSLQCSLLAASG